MSDAYPGSVGPVGHSEPVPRRRWSVRTPDGVLHPDLAGSYAFPTREMLPIAGLVAFYDEKVDVTVDGVLQERPVTHLS